MAKEPHPFHIGRIQNLTDGIFAVGMTLLVIDIRVAPGFDRSTLGQGLLQLVPNIYSYVVSFFILALFWWTYHRMLDRITRADTGFVWWNIGFLFLVTLVPFSAYLLGQFYGTRAATEIYCLNLAALAVMMFAEWRHAETQSLVNPNLTIGERKEITARLSSLIFAYFGTALIGLWQPYWFFFGFALIGPARAITRRFTNPSDGRDANAH